MGQIAEALRSSQPLSLLAESDAHHELALQRSWIRKASGKGTDRTGEQL